GAPLPSMTWAPRITRSSIVSLPLLLRLPSAGGVLTSPLRRARCLSPQPLCYMVVRRERRRNTPRYAAFVPFFSPSPYQRETVSIWGLRKHTMPVLHNDTQ